MPYKANAIVRYLQETDSYIFEMLQVRHKKTRTFELLHALDLRSICCQTQLKDTQQHRQKLLWITVVIILEIKMLT